MNSKASAGSSERARLAILAMLPRETWMQNTDLKRQLKRAGFSGGTVERMLIKLLEIPQVERRYTRSAMGHRTQAWRLFSGVPTPLYDLVPGCDARPLADCFGGMTYVAAL